jgi:Uma2 family endonuclease
VNLTDSVRYFSPDVSVVCRSKPQTNSFQDEPVVIFEVLSKSTRHGDTGEKKDANLTIPSLQVNVLAELEASLALLFRRTARRQLRS